jgi:hypothetical protein
VFFLLGTILTVKSPMKEFFAKALSIAGFRRYFHFYITFRISLSFEMELPSYCGKKGTRSKAFDNLKIWVFISRSAIFEPHQEMTISHLF